MLRVVRLAVLGRLAPIDSGLWCLAKNVERQALNRRARPRWPACPCLHPNSQIRWRFLQRTAANNIQCRPWRRHCPCLCRCGFWWGRLLAIRAIGCETWRARLRPWGTLDPAANALRVRGTSCAVCRGRRCEWSQFRCQTNRHGRAPESPWGTNQSGHRARHIRPGSPLG